MAFPGPFFVSLFGQTKKEKEKAIREERERKKTIKWRHYLPQTLPDKYHPAILLTYSIIESIYLYYFFINPSCTCLNSQKINTCSLFKRYGSCFIIRNHLIHDISKHIDYCYF